MFSKSLLSGSGAHLASYSMGRRRFFLGYSCRDVNLSDYFHIVHSAAVLPLSRTPSRHTQKQICVFRAERKRKKEKLHFRYSFPFRTELLTGDEITGAIGCQDEPRCWKCLGSFPIMLSHHILRNSVTSQPWDMHMFQGLYLTADIVAFLLSVGCSPSKKTR